MVQFQRRNPFTDVIGNEIQCERGQLASFAHARKAIRPMQGDMAAAPIGLSRKSLFHPLDMASRAMPVKSAAVIYG